MSKRAFLGEFEQMVLLAVLKQGNDAYGVTVSRELESNGGRRVSRSALYTTLDRLKKKGLLDWRLEAGGEERSRLPKRSFTVTADGIEALRSSRDVLLRLWQGTEEFLGEPAP